MEEHQLIAQVLAGNATAENELYETHVDRVYRLAYRMTGDSTMAEDYTQETFVRVFTSLGSFQGRSKLGTWIHSIAVSVVLSGLRKIKRLRNRELPLNEEIDSVAGCKPTSPALKVRLHNAIDRLPEDIRIVLVMHDVEGYKHREISEAVGAPVGTTKSRLSRAREELRSALTLGNPGFAEEDWR